MTVSEIWKNYNDKIAYAIRFLWWLNFILPIRFFFYTQYLWVSVALSTVILLISTWVWMLFEIPTGTWADKYGRKKIFLIGSAIKLLWLIPLVITKSIVVIVIWSVVWWFGGALVSWTLGPLIYDWFKSIGQKNEYKKYTRRWSMLVFGWRAVATIVWWRLFTLNPLYPYYGIIITKILAILLAASLYEWENVIYVEEIPMGTFIKQWRKHLTSSYWLNTILIWFILWNFFWSVVWWLYQPFLTDNGLSIQQIWWFYAWASLISMTWSYTTKYFYTDTISEKLLAGIYLALVCLTLISFIFVDGYWIFLWVILVQLSFGMHTPITNNAINHHIPSSHRSTANSIFSLLDSTWWFFGWSLCWIFLTTLWFDGVWIAMLLWSSLTLLYVLIRKKSLKN
jgi:MFS family permease